MRSGSGYRKTNLHIQLELSENSKKKIAGRLSESNKVSTMQYMRRVGAHTIMAVNMFLLSSIIELKWTMAGVSVHYNDQGGWSSSLELYLRRHGGLKTGDTGSSAVGGRTSSTFSSNSLHSALIKSGCCSNKKVTLTPRMLGTSPLDR